MASKTTGLLIGGGIAALAFILSKRAMARTPGVRAIAQPTLPGTPAPDAKVGRYFTLKEFLQSKTFPKLRNYRPTPNELMNLKILAGKILDPLRKQFGPIVITGGARPESVARAYGTTWYDAFKKRGLDPAKKSDHAWFGAADIRPTKLKTVKQWRMFIRAIEANPHVRQALTYLTKNPDGTYRAAFFHVAVATPTHPVLRRKMIYRLNGQSIKEPTIFQKAVA